MATDIPSTLSKPEATLVIVEHTPESGLGLKIRGGNSNQAHNIRDIHDRLTSNSAVSQEGNNMRKPTESLYVGDLTTIGSGSTPDSCPKPNPPSGPSMSTQLDITPESNSLVELKVEDDVFSDNSKDLRELSLIQSADMTTTTITFTSIDEYEAQMLKDLDACSSDDGARRLFYTRSPSNHYGNLTFEGTSNNYSRPIRLEGKQSQLRVKRDEALSQREQVYYVVLCLMLDQDIEGIDQMFIGKLKIDLGPPPEKGEVSIVRVLLRYQAGPNLIVELCQKGKTTPGSILLCYVELSQSPPNVVSYDCILPRFTLPRRAFNIQHNISVGSRDTLAPATIFRVAISASGSHAATLAKTGEKMFLDLWELRLSEATSTVTFPYTHTVSSAHAAIEILTGYPKNPKLTLSWDGSQIVVYRVLGSSPDTSYLFEYPRDIHQQSHNQQVSLSLQLSKRHNQYPGLQSLSGEAMFVNISTAELGDISERFVACEQSGFSVFKTTESWEMLYHIPTLRCSTFSGYHQVMSAAVGGILALQTSPYQISIWDLASGTPKHLIETTREIRNNLLSSTGETLAVDIGRTLLLYSATSGALLQRHHISSEEWLGFIDGDRYIYGCDPYQPPHNYFMADIGDPFLSKKYIMPLLSTDQNVRDIITGGDWQGTNIKSTLVAYHHGSNLEVSYLEDLPSSTEDEFQCTRECILDVSEVPEIVIGSEVSYPGGIITTQASDHGLLKNISLYIRFKDGKMRQYWWVSSRFHLQEKCSQFTTVYEKSTLLCLSIWRLPRSSQDELELLFYWELNGVNTAHTLSTCSHGGNPTLSTSGGNVRLYEGTSRVALDVKVLFKTIYRIDTSNEMQCYAASEAVFKYIRSFANYYPVPGDHSVSLISKICKARDKFNHERVSLVLKKLLQTDNSNNTISWIPLRIYSKRSNPVGIILEKARVDPTVIEMAHIIIEYCLNKARELDDITYILYLLEYMDELTTRYADVALQITRGFGYIRCHDREFVIKNHKIAHPPTFRRFWALNNLRIYECWNPILQVHLNDKGFDAFNDTFTEEVFVAPVNLLWSFVPKALIPCNEFPLGDPHQTTTWLLSLYHAILFNMNPFSHVYIRPRFYKLEIIDNPAIEAVIQYKWYVSIGQRLSCELE
ncbi:hypothetical protein BGW38_001791 [Lunasporangiospora selenospora]|uniref:Uncharacterized protein n=1 Tax=Lunasporangiospora selenospora TaxID=979761 RepID=A0A9P6G3D0_9FUNG|nr:hypothetical protein BGW38_001791 [Lunasporangiospora selenospora]